MRGLTKGVFRYSECDVNSGGSSNCLRLFFGEKHERKYIGIVLHIHGLDYFAHYIVQSKTLSSELLQRNKFVLY